MAPSYIPPRPLQPLILVLVAISLATFSTADLAQDRAECTKPLIGLATCLPYVGGDSKAPTQDCCAGLAQVLKNSFKCLCVLVKDRDDPNLGLKINATLALGLPSACHTPVNISRCIELLRLDLNSPDAKTFSGFEKSLEQTNSTKSTIVNGVPNQSRQTGSNLKSDGSMMKPLPGALKAALGVVIWTFLLLPKD